MAGILVARAPPWGSAELGNLNGGTRRCRVTNVRICRNEYVRKRFLQLSLEATDIGLSGGKARVWRLRTPSKIQWM